MQSRVTKSFSGVDGAGEGIVRHFQFDFDIASCPYLSDTSCTSFSDFSSGKISHKKALVIARFRDFAQHLEGIYGRKIDPIQYLLQLYYKEELSVEEIFERHYTFGYKGPSSLWHMMTHSLGWELRDRTELNERRLNTKKSPRNPALKGLQASSTQLMEYNIEKCLKILTPFTSERSPSDFSLETFHSFEGKGSKGKKIWYILSQLHGITPNIIYQINSEQDIGARTLARVLNTKLESSCILYHIPYKDVSLQAADISYVLQMKKQGKTLAIESLS